MLVSISPRSAMFIMPEALELILCFFPSAAASPPLLASDVPADILCAGTENEDGVEVGGIVSSRCESAVGLDWANRG